MKEILIKDIFEKLKIGDYIETENSYRIFTINYFTVIINFYIRRRLLFRVS